MKYRRLWSVSVWRWMLERRLPLFKIGDSFLHFRSFLSKNWKTSKKGLVSIGIKMHGYPSETQLASGDSLKSTDFWTKMALMNYHNIAFEYKCLWYWLLSGGEMTKKNDRFFSHFFCLSLRFVSKRRFFVLELLSDW